jgi:DMSO/TMAO reductase YedYZ heme-binding membrane subunit
MGFSLAAMHALMAMLLFSPNYYAKFFHESGQLNLNGELSMVFGVLSLWCLTITAITCLPFMYDAVGADRWKRGQRMGYFSLLLVAGHLIVMGLHGWLSPSGWPAYLPPISMVAFIAAIIPLLVKMTSTSKQKE